MDINRLVIARPSGNITAIVFDETAPEDMRDVGAAIQDAYPSVEQVMFVQKRGNVIHGQMAGGEFCGNAARSLGYVLADGKSTAETFTMSGLSAPITVEAMPGRAKLKMHSHLEPDHQMLGNTEVPIIHLEGISHAVLFPEHPLFHFLKEYAARPDRWNTVKHVLDDLKLTEKPACGLIFAEKEGCNVRITPYVYVRDIETLYPETSCASGSIAVASLNGRKASIIQPSNETLKVSIRHRADTIFAEVDGPISIDWDGPAKDLHLSKRSSHKSFLRPEHALTV